MSAAARATRLFLLLAVSLVPLAPAHPTAGQECTHGVFGPGLPVTGNGPYDMAIGNLNGDGYPDMVVVNAGSDDVYVYLGADFGDFAYPVSHSAGVNPIAVVISDLDGDGAGDFVVLHGGFLNIAVLRIFKGHGDGTFTVSSMNAGTGGRALAAGDLNNDGIPDLAACYSDGLVRTFLGNGDASFGPPTFNSVPGQPLAIAMSDLNGDGALDVVTANYTVDSVSVLLGLGDGSLAPDVSYAVDDQPKDLAIGDLNNDGIPDIATVNHYQFKTDPVSVLLGLGDGTFGSHDTLWVCCYLQLQSIAIADLDGDGSNDLAISGSGEFGSFALFLGHGDGTFEPPMYDVVGRAPLAITVSDLNADQLPDLLAVDIEREFVIVVHATAPGVFEEHPPWPPSFPAGTAPLVMGTADFDDDGHADLATVNQSGNIGVTLGFGDGTFGPLSTLDVGPDPHGLAIADLNADGYQDFATNLPSGSVVVLLGAGDGSFAAPITSPIWPPGNRIAVADLDGDGALDLAVTTSFPGIRILLGNGDGSFIAAQALEIGNTAWDVLLEDLNGDSSPDVVALASAAGSEFAAACLGLGDGTFTACTLFATVPGGTRMQPADFNNDGNTDVAVAGTDSTAVMLGAGDGTLALQAPVSRPEWFYEIDAADFDGDGAADVAVGNFSHGPDDVTLWRGQGDGTLAQQALFVAGKTGLQGYLAAADFNGDGAIDLAVTGPDGTTSILLNTCLCGNGTTDIGEDCDGEACCAPLCTFTPAETLCRPSQGPCDPFEESCTGDSAECPEDVRSPAGTVCAPATGPCQIDAQCDGASAACPPNDDILSCINGDGCCPPSGLCTANDDDDCPPVCGNGVVEAGECCDDGNLSSADGCDTQCACQALPVPAISAQGMALLLLVLASALALRTWLLRPNQGARRSAERP